VALKRADDTTQIDDLPALRALADPLRLKILDLLSDTEKSVRELAADLDVARNKLHYHVNILEQHGLVRVESTRMDTGGAPERRYRSTGRTFQARNLPIPGEVAAGIAGMLGTAAQELDAHLRSERRGPTAVGRVRVRLTEAKHDELVERLGALLDEYKGGESGGGAADESGDRDAAATFVFGLYEDPDA
jgi:DNA-binding transcriptional ArsR family regulator